jgi:hypothetical protein
MGRALTLWMGGLVFRDGGAKLNYTLTSDMNGMNAYGSSRYVLEEEIEVPCGNFKTSISADSVSVASIS